MGGKTPEPQKAQEVKEKAVLARSQILRANYGFLTPSGFQQRLAFFTAKVRSAPTPPAQHFYQSSRKAHLIYISFYFLMQDTGVLNQKIEKRDMTEMMMTNPDMMSGMMKQQLGGLGPQLALGAFVNFFFRGFILGKLPFSLSPKFRGMLQSGIDLPSLDVAYLSSLSYYMLLLFGSRGVMTLFFQDSAVNDVAMMSQMQMQGQMAFMNPAAVDPGKAFAAEAQALDLVQYRWRMAGSEARATQLLRKRLSGR